jgi:hypothetical protein
MPVGNIQRGNAREFTLDEFDLRRIVHDPRRMPHAIGRGEIHVRLLRDFLGDEFVQRRLRAIREEHRAGLGIERLDMAHAIVFLIGARELVFFDNPAQIFLAARDRNKPDLGMFTHDLPVQIKTRRGVLPQCALRDECLEIFFAPGVNFWRINIRAGRQIDFRFADVQKAEGIASGHGACLLRRHDIVREFTNTARQFGFRAQSSKRSQSCHKLELRRYNRGAGTHVETELGHKLLARQASAP